eukprot:2205416-Amphidinium_carterae.1
MTATSTTTATATTSKQGWPGGTLMLCFKWLLARGDRRRLTFASKHHATSSDSQAVAWVAALGSFRTQTV